MYFVLEASQECITIGSFTCAEVFYFLKYIININTWKLQRSPSGGIIDSNDTWILGCLLCLKIAFSITWDVLSAKRWVSLNSGIFRFLTGLEKKVFKISAFLTSCLKMLSLSTVFQHYLSFIISLCSFIINTYLLIPYIGRRC